MLNKKIVLLLLPTLLFTSCHSSKSQKGEFAIPNVKFQDHLTAPEDDLLTDQLEFGLTNVSKLEGNAQIINYQYLTEDIVQENKVQSHGVYQFYLDAVSAEEEYEHTYSNCYEKISYSALAYYGSDGVFIREESSYELPTYEKYEINSTNELELDPSFRSSTVSMDVFNQLVMIGYNLLPSGLTSYTTYSKYDIGHISKNKIAALMVIKESARPNSYSVPNKDFVLSVDFQEYFLIEFDTKNNQITKVEMKAVLMGNYYNNDLTSGAGLIFEESKKLGEAECSLKIEYKAKENNLQAQKMKQEFPLRFIEQARLSYFNIYEVTRDESNNVIGMTRVDNSYSQILLEQDGVHLTFSVEINNASDKKEYAFLGFINLGGSYTPDGAFDFVYVEDYVEIRNGEGFEYLGATYYPIKPNFNYDGSCRININYLIDGVGGFAAVAS